MTRARPLSDKDIDRLSERIGHVFANRDRVVRALTHSSSHNARGGNYERLEFLGDRVLGLCIAQMLFNDFKSASEGELSVRLNQLVSAQTCAAVADDLGMHEFIRTGSDIKSVTGKRMASVRADVMEALIAAIYLDGGLEAARGFITRNWSTRARDQHAARRDAKTELQEWAHARSGVTPSYRVLDRSGPDHDPQFTVRVEIEDLEPETGISRSKRTAEQEAATKMLKREGVWPSETAE
ncbi:ribonuclease III [Pararhizobium haloflavum]|uniref:ribonuclease III n=1 Tax=Pararhizobium haloflavum TaxID=2037914 RepID=UPI000C17CD23|nr:ribonuclease III [Pararhizobium haloflavum]